MEKIPFCFPIFYHGLIAERTIYSQPDVINILVNGTVESETDTSTAIPAPAANRIIKGKESIPANRRNEILALSDDELLARIQKIKIQNIQTTIAAFHEFLRKRTLASAETIYYLASSIQEGVDPYRYYMASLREALFFKKKSDKYITDSLIDELQNLHKSSHAAALFRLQQAAMGKPPCIMSISLTPDKTFSNKIVGRNEIVQGICNRLKDKEERIHLCGMGGIGKSEVLRKVYSWFFENPGDHIYDRIAYIYYTGNLKSDLSNAIDYPGKNSDADSIQYLIQLASAGQILLFIDDVRNYERDKSDIYKSDVAFDQIIDSGVSILFASRIMRKGFSHVSIKPLPIDSCVDIFLREYTADIDVDILVEDDIESCGSEILTAEDKEKLVQIIDGRAGRNTLVVSRLSAMTRDFGWTIAQLEQQLIDKGFNIRKGLSEYDEEYVDEQTLQDELNKLYDYKEIKTAAERSILEGFTLLADVPADIDTCAQWFSRDAEIDEDRCRNVLIRLMRRSWLLTSRSGRNDGKVHFSMHNIVRAAIQSQANVNRKEHQDLVMKVWTNLTIEVRKKDENEPKWADRIYAVPGERVRFRIGIRNMSSEMFRNLTLRDILPTGLSYINGSTRIYNPKHPQGVTLSDNIVTDMGVNIGDYAPGANAWIYFDAATPEMASNENIIYRNVIQACGGYGAKEKSADVIVDACET